MPGGSPITRLAFAAAVSLFLAACGRHPARSESTMVHTPEHSPEALSLGRITPREPGAVLELLCDDIDTQGVIAERHTAFGANLSPHLHWTPVEGAGAYAIIVEDPDAPREKPFVHWMIWNIPGNLDYLPEGIPNNEAPVTPQGAVQAKNDNGSFGYFGPEPPPGTGLHHYHFQIFALEGPLTLHGDADIRALVNSMQGRVLADGELIGTVAAPAE
jgi:Raf kinase inhibitor-like YbhB/YbcL family protein